MPEERSYAHRDLVDKLGVKPGMAIQVVGQGDPAVLSRIAERLARPFADSGETPQMALYWPANLEEVRKQWQRFVAACQTTGLSGSCSPRKGT